MSVPEQLLREWIDSKEGEHFEFKQAKNRYDFDELVQYCVALANEGGGKVLLGVTDKRPRQIVGSQAFDQPERTRSGLIDRLRLRIDFDEIATPAGRVLAFHVPPRPVGTPIEDKGIYWVRDADRLVPMPADRLRQAFAESGRDFTAEVCPDASLSDLDPAAVADFRRRWIAKSGNAALARLSDEQLLADAEALDQGRPTYAALVLFGTRAVLGRRLAQAEVTFEYRSSDASGPAQARKEYRQGFFSYYDDLWNTINLRNDLQHYQDGLFVLDIPTFAERPVREAILNAVSHRDYQLGGNVFVRQYPRRIEIVSPGGLPHTITLDNILDRQSPRNRRIADLFTKCGLVERSGQGMNLIYEESIRQSKPIPDFTNTDAYQVAITLHGTVQDPQFIRFLERVGRERLARFSTQDFLILDWINRDQPVPVAYQSRVPYLLEQGIVERAGRGKCMLSRQFYRFVRKKGMYTRKKGLDRETNKALLLKHIEDNRDEGSPLHELLQVLPGLSRDQVQTLLRELKAAGKAHPRGTTRNAKWFPGPAAENIASDSWD
jgi:ATP-dependent DNA helicase RecG